MQTIETRYYITSSGRGKIRARASGGYTEIFDYDYRLSSEQNHINAAKTLRDSLQWKTALIGGDTKTGMVFVFANGYVID